MKNIEKLINLINKENLFPNLSENNFEEFFGIYLLSCNIDDIDENFIHLQNEYLKNKYSDKIVEYKLAMKSINSPLDIKTDLLIIFSENLIIDAGAIYSGKYSMDNELIIRGGVEIKENIYRQYEQDRFVLNFRRPYIFDGVNMPAKVMAKILVDTKCDHLDSEQKILGSIDNLLVWIKENKITDCVLCLNNFTKNNKKIEKYIKKALKSAKIKKILEIL